MVSPRATGILHGADGSFLACYAFQIQMKLPRHIPQLDVLRGLAVLDVMLYHAIDMVPRLHLRIFFNLGYTGVDLFFVLSGFLITGILVQTKADSGYFVNFYARRALRIWPLYYALVIFTFVVLPWIAPQLKGAIFDLSHPWQSFPFFLQNLTLKHEAFDTLRVTWSLAIEEQFYLVWPLIVWLTPRRMLKHVALAAVLISAMVRWSTFAGLAPPVNTYTNTFARLDGLGLGAFLALWIPESESRHVKLAGFGAIALALPVTIAVGWSLPGHWAFNTLVSLCFAGLLCVAINLPQLENREFLKYTGKISYCLYLVHVPVIQLMQVSLVRRYFTLRSPILHDAILLIVCLAVCYGIAELSWRFFESKFLPLKSKFEVRPVITASLPWRVPQAGDAHS